MDKAQLLTYLSECFLIPSALLGGYITWESIDSAYVRAFITYKGVTGSGILTYDGQERRSAIF